MAGARFSSFGPPDDPPPGETTVPFFFFYRQWLLSATCFSFFPCSEDDGLFFEGFSSEDLLVDLFFPLVPVKRLFSHFVLSKGILPLRQ